MTQVVETNPLNRDVTHLIDSSVGRIEQSDGAASANCAADQMKRDYGADGYLDFTIDFNGHRSNYDYDARGQLLTRTEAAGTALARTTRWTWIAARTLPLTEQIDGHSLTTYTYTANERLQSISNKNLTAFGTANEERTTTISYTLHPLSGLKATSPSSSRASTTRPAMCAGCAIMSLKSSLAHRWIDW